MLAQQRSDELDAFKGVLIALIVLGHNYYFGGRHPLWFSVLYNFHVACFLLFPFIFSMRKLGVRHLIDRLGRAIIPQFLFLALIIPIYFYLFVPKQWGAISSWLWDLALALLVQNEQVFEEVSGFRHFWFLPAMVSLLVLLYWYEHSGRTLRLVIISTALVWHGVAGLMPLGVILHIPWGLPIVGFVFLPGLIIRYLYQTIEWNGFLDFFVIGVWCFGLWWCVDQRWFMALAGDIYRVKTVMEPVRLLFHDVFLILSFFAVLRLGAWVTGGVLPYLGRQSLKLFLITPLLWQVYWMGGGEGLFGQKTNWSPMLILVSWGLILALGWLVSILIQRSPLNSVLFPRGFADWAAAMKGMRAGLGSRCTTGR